MVRVLPMAMASSSLQFASARHISLPHSSAASVRALPSVARLGVSPSASASNPTRRITLFHLGSGEPRLFFVLFLLFWGGILTAAMSSADFCCCVRSRNLFFILMLVLSIFQCKHFWIRVSYLSPWSQENEFSFFLFWANGISGLKIIFYCIFVCMIIGSVCCFITLLT